MTSSKRFHKNQRFQCQVDQNVSFQSGSPSQPWLNAVRITQLNKEKTDFNLDINDVVQVAKKKNLVPFVKFVLDLFQIEVSHLYTLAMDVFTLIHHILMSQTQTCSISTNLVCIYRQSMEMRFLT
jgi:hypothetical protein